MDLGDWLRSLGLEHYEAAFRENAIDDTVLPSLTAEDLKDIGVGIVGRRRKPLDAITAMRADANVTVSSPSTWAMGCSPISAILVPTRTTPSGRCGPGWRLSKRC